MDTETKPEPAPEPTDHRKKLLPERPGFTLHFTIISKLPARTEGEEERVVECNGYVTTGEYPDGRLGEVFICISKATKRLQAMGPMFDEWAKDFSKALQYGAPLDALCDGHIGTRFEPAGPVRGVAGITRCTSPTDLICRWLKAKYGTKDTP